MHKQICNIPNNSNNNQITIMNTVRYVFNRFFKKSNKDKISLIKCLFVNPRTIKQIYKILKLRNESQFFGYVFVNINDIELGHDVVDTVRHSKQVIERRCFLISLADRKKWPIELLKASLPSSNNIQLFFDEEKNKYICLDGNGRVFCFKKLNGDFLIECEIYMRKK